MDTKNRKHSVLVISLLIVVTAGVFVFLFRDKLSRSVRQLVSEKVGEQPLEKRLETKCDFTDDQAAFVAAMENVNPAFCGCINDRPARQRCDVQSLEALRFQQVVGQLNESRCREFAGEQKDKLCQQAIAGRLEAMANDPLILAENYLESGNYVQAVQVLDKSIRADDKNVDILLMLALVYANQGLAEHREGELVSKALALVEKALALKADHPEAYRVRGFINEVKPDYAAAIDDYTKAIELDNKFILAYVGRGHAANMNGQIGDALGDFKAAKELDKDRLYPQIYSQLCRLESQGPMLEDAIADCLINIEMATGVSKAEAHGMLALLQLRAGRLDEARRNAQMAMVLTPNDSNAYITASQAYLESGDAAGAKQYAEKALALDNTRSAAHLQLAATLLEQEQVSKAIESVLRSLDLVDRDVAILKPEKLAAKHQCYKLLVEAYAKQGDKANEEKYRQMQSLPAEE